MANKITFPAVVKEKFSKGEELARGRYGVVYKCENLETKMPVALKIMLKRGNKREDVLKEVEVLKKISHPGILQIMDFMECEKEFVMVTELLNGGELFDYVLEKEYLAEKEASFYLHQILEAISFFHQHKIVHLDLKPENIVLKEKDGKSLKIIDFGTAQDLSLNPRPKVMVGTPEFIAPEVLNYDPVTTASDMWAVGIITFVLLTGASPFLGDNDMETVANIAAGEYDYPDPDEDGYEDISDLAKDFIDTMLRFKSGDRGSAQSMLVHKWLASSSSKILNTARLKSFRARRRWLAITRAARITISLSKFALKPKRPRADSFCPVSPGGSSTGGGDV